MKLVALGKPERVSKSGLILIPVSPTDVPNIGEKVVTRKMEKIGVVVDVIGPVTSPYALVKPDKVVYEDLFVVKEHGRDRKGSGKGERSRKGSRKKGD